MAIQKFQDSFSDMASSNFSTMLDRFFNDSLAARGRTSSFSPHVDAYETEKSYEIEVALPGMKREDIKVDFHQGRLTIAGERQFRNEQNQRRYHLVESSFRSFQLPDTVDASSIQASFEDGVLRVSVPKDEQKTMRHQIQIQGGQRSAANQDASSGQISERMGQQATDAVQQPSNEQNGNGSNGARKQNNTRKHVEEMNSRPQSSGVGS